MYKISPRTEQWLFEWLNETGNDTVLYTQMLMENNNEILNELIAIQYANKQYYDNIKLYRGTTKDHGEYYSFPKDRITSWTYSKSMANNFGDYVYECNFNNDDILIMMIF